MKNQYFGDIRDLFKYDLILRVLKEATSINHFMFIPMLTENDDRGDGNKINYSEAKAGTQNNDLMTYLRNRIEGGRRNITEIEDYFKSKGIKTYIRNELFVHRDRKRYFDKIIEELPPCSLIFIDPDNGLEVKRSNEKHLLYQEAKDLYKRMDEDSALMIYQHFPRENHAKYLRRRSDELRELLGDLPIYVSDNEIISFLSTRDGELKSQLEMIIKGYKGEYPNLRIGNINSHSA